MNLLSEIPSDIGHIPLKEVILQAGIATNAGRICQNLGKTLVICDENTNDFVNAGNDRITLPGDQKPDLLKAQELAKHRPDYFIAVGSGSLNDVVKYASFLAKKPYIVFGTAPSMNGYVSANASLLEDGYKKSFAAHAPQAVYLDTEILKAAPTRLINSGIGDSICRGTTQADAILSHQVLGTPDYAELFKLMKKYEDAIFDDVEALTKTLIMSGIAMLVAGSSAPASQSEHILAHYMELMDEDAPHSYHGEQISVTTITMSKLQEKLLAEKDTVEPSWLDEEDILSHFGHSFGKYCLSQTWRKYESLKEVELDKKAIEKALISSEIIYNKLKSVNAPLAAEDIGWNKDIYSKAIYYSRYTRDRFTFLDLQ